MTLIIVLLATGILSLLERVLLASIQYRQGPTSSALHGISLLLLDGVKLYSKHGLDTHLFSHGLALISAPLVLLTGLLPLVLSLGALTSLSSEPDILLFSALATLATISLTLPALSTPNTYSSLGATRLVRAALLADIVLITGLLTTIIVYSAFTSGSTLLAPTSLAGHWMLLTPLWLGLLLSTGKAPFDLAEAESELVAGLLTELGGCTFSVSLVADNAELIAYQLLWATQLSILAVSCLLVMGCTNLSFIGRCILVRIAVFDVPKLALGVIIWPFGAYLNVFALSAPPVVKVFINSL